MAWLNILFCDTSTERGYNIEEIINNSDFSECTVFITSTRNMASELIESGQLFSVMIIGYDLNKIGDGNDAINFIKKYRNIPSIFLDNPRGIISRAAENYATITLNKNNVYYGLNEAIVKIIKDKNNPVD
ncbi:MAG: hypothetical protein AABX55_02795 [Nanoarchaeota archaeon]